MLSTNRTIFRYNTVEYGTFISKDDNKITMAMQEVKQRNFPDTILDSPKTLGTSTSVVECYVCGKGLLEGHSITAKTLPSGIVLFCNIHYPS